MPRCQLSRSSGQTWGLEYNFLPSGDVKVVKYSLISPFSFSPLRPGDIINSINGRILKGISQEALQQLLSSTNYLDLEYTRAGTENRTSTTPTNTTAPTPSRTSTTPAASVIVIESSSSSNNSEDDDDFGLEWRRHRGYYSDEDDYESSIGDTESDGVINLISDDDSPTITTPRHVQPTPPRVSQNVPPVPIPASLPSGTNSQTSPAEASATTNQSPPQPTIPPSPSQTLSASLPVHTPPIGSPPARKRARTTPSGIVMKFEPVGFGCADVGDEVVEVPNPNQIAVNELKPCADVDEDMIEVIGGYVTNAGDMPHPRESCSKYPFLVSSFGSNVLKNKLFCPQCYCYVCEVKASECINWSSHCDATRKLSAWRSIKATLTSPLMLLFPPNKRPEMSQLGQCIMGTIATELHSHIQRAENLLKSVKTETNLETQKSSYVEAVFILWSAVKRSISNYFGNIRKISEDCLLHLGIALLMTESFTVPYAPKQICHALQEECAIMTRSMVLTGIAAAYTIDLMSTLLLLATPERKVNPDWLFRPTGRSEFPTGLNLANSDASSLVFKVLQDVGASQLILMEFAFLYNHQLFSKCFADLLMSLNVEYLQRFVSHIMESNSKFTFDVLLEFNDKTLTFQHIFILFSLLQRANSIQNSRKQVLFHSLGQFTSSFLLKTITTAELDLIRALFQNRVEGASLIPQSVIDNALSVVALEPSEIVSKFTEYTASNTITDIYFAFILNFLSDWGRPSSMFHYSRFLGESAGNINRQPYLATYFLHFGLQWTNSSAYKDKIVSLLSNVALHHIACFSPNPSFHVSDLFQTIPDALVELWRSSSSVDIPPLGTPWSPPPSKEANQPRVNHIQSLIRMLQVSPENEAVSLGSITSTIFDMAVNVFLEHSLNCIKDEYNDEHSVIAIIEILRSPLLQPFTVAKYPEIFLLPKQLDDITVSELGQFKSVAKTKNDSSHCLWGLWQRLLPRIFSFSMTEKMILEDFDSVRRDGVSFLTSLSGKQNADFNLDNPEYAEFTWSVINEQHKANPATTLRLLDQIAQKSPSLFRQLIYYCPLNFVNEFIVLRSPSIIFHFRDAEKAVSDPSHPHHSLHPLLSSYWTQISTNIALWIDLEVSMLAEKFTSKMSEIKTLEDSFLISLAIHQTYIMKKVLVLLLDQQLPHKMFLIRVMKIATTIEDIAVILQHTIEYVRQWGKFSSIADLPLYSQMNASANPLILEACAVLNPSVQSISNFLENYAPTDPQQTEHLVKNWKESLSEKDYFLICLKYLSIEYLERFLEERSTASQDFNESNPLVREALESIATSYKTISAQKSFLLLHWAVAFFLSLRWEDDFSFTSTFTEFLLNVQQSIIDSGLPLPEPSPLSIEIPPSKFGLILFPFTAFKIFTFLIRPTPELYCEIMKFPLNDDTKLKLLGASQQNMSYFVHLCGENRQYEYLFKQLAKKVIANSRDYLSILQATGLVTSSHFTCSQQDMNLLQEYGLSSDQFITISILAKRSCLLPILQWIRHLYVQKLVDSQTCSGLLLLFRATVQNNLLGCALIALFESALTSIFPLVTLIHTYLADDLITSSLKKLQFQAKDCFQIVLDACCPEQAVTGGRIRIMRYIRYMEFLATCPCSIPSCGCSILRDSGIPAEILRDGITTIVQEMLAKPPTGRTMSLLDDAYVAEIMTTQLKPIYELITSHPQLDVKALLPQIIACTHHSKFHYLLRYCLEVKNVDYFYPLLKIVYQRENRPFHHFEFLLTLKSQSKLTYDTFREAFDEASNQSIRASWITWLKDLFSVNIQLSASAAPILTKFLLFLMSFPHQQEIEPPVLQDLWKNIFSILIAGAGFSFWSVILDNQSESIAERMKWLSHVQAILATGLNLISGVELGNFLAVCRIAIKEHHAFPTISNFLSSYCGKLVSDRVDQSKRQLFERMMMGLKAEYAGGNEDEWKKVCAICIRILNPKKKVQEIVKALM